MPLTIKGTSAGGFTVKGNMTGASAANIKNYLPSQEAGVFLWLRGDLGITLNGSTVSAWANQGTAGGSFIQATAARQPSYNVSGQAGWPSLTWTPASLTNLLWSSSSTINAASNYTFFFACNPTTATSASQLWLMDIAGLPSGSPRLIFAQDATVQSKHVAFYRASSGLYQGTTDNGTTGGQILTFELDSTTLTSSTIYRNGSSIASSLAYDQIAISPGNTTVALTLGAANSGTSSNFAGDMFEVIGVNNLTSGMRQRVENYLKIRYGNPLY